MRKPRRTRVVVLATAALLLAGCGHSNNEASVSVRSDPPFSITSGPLDYKPADVESWFHHDVMVENLSDQVVVIDYDKSRGGKYLGHNQLLVVDEGCGPGGPIPGKSSGVPCTAIAHAPLTVAPHASAKLMSITAVAGLKGMSSIKKGSYVWDKDLTWHFADTSENKTSHVTLTYTKN